MSEKKRKRKRECVCVCEREREREREKDGALLAECRALQSFGIDLEIFPSLLQNIVSFIGLICKRDL